MSPVDEAIVLAGGLGTRLRSIVSDVPKPLAPVAGRPFLEWLLQSLAGQGIRRCVLATGYLSGKIQNALGSTCHGIELVYSVETEPLGTGGAVALAARQLLGGAAHIVNGDTFLRYQPAALERLARHHNAIGMAVAHVDDVSRYGAVNIESAHARGFTEKGLVGEGWINAGCYFFDEAALMALPAGRFSLEEEVLKPAARAGNVVALTATAEFIDIGVPEDYLRAQKQFGCAN